MKDSGLKNPTKLLKRYPTEILSLDSMERAWWLHFQTQGKQITWLNVTTQNLIVIALSIIVSRFLPTEVVIKFALLIWILILFRIYQSIQKMIDQKIKERNYLNWILLLQKELEQYR